VLTAENVCVTELLAAASIVVSEPALEALQARTGPPRSGEAKN
jgi:hypothetical protein